MDTDNDNDPTPIEQRDSPGGDVSQRSLATFLAAEAHHVGDTLLDAAALYGAGKVISKIRKPPPPPPPPPSASASDGEA